MKSVNDFLREATLKKEEVDRFLDDKQPNWACFDPELGYLIRDGLFQDGMDNSWTIGRYQKNAERLTINGYAQKCRINTYGNSFTQCQQVSDGETWQEYLGAHLGEPIRNFGIGGYGVYQAYRRMLRMESTDLAAPYVMLNIWGIDDHYRSMDAWRWLRCLDWFRRPEAVNMFHCNPWDHVRLNPVDGSLVEIKSLAPDVKGLYDLCDPDFVIDQFRSDLALCFYLGSMPQYEVDLGPIRPFADMFGVKLDLSTAETRAASIQSTALAYALRLSELIVELASDYAVKNNKKLMVLLSYFFTNIIDEIEGRPRADQSFLDFLGKRGIRFVDVLAKHVEDYKAFNLAPGDYVQRYFIGHYNPKGNHFFAFAIKDSVIEWLDPRPATYHKEGRRIGFERYLPID